jgi:hypothetical protein
VSSRDDSSAASFTAVPRVASSASLRARLPLTDAMIPSGPVTELALSAIVAWSLAVLMHWWPRLRGTARRRLAVVTSIAGIAFLLAAMRAEGLRESAITSMVIVGPAWHTATASATASLHYYVLTGVCLLLGFAGLAAGEPLARWLAPRWLASSVAVACLVTLLRFLLEKSAAPALLVQSIGVTWMAPVAGAYLATGLHHDRPGWRPLVTTLAAYAFLVRGFVALFVAFSTLRALGTHYDVSPLTAVPLPLLGGTLSFAPGSAAQVLWLALVPQLVLWPLFTIGAGLAGALAVRTLAPRAGGPLGGRTSEQARPMAGRSN